MAIVPTIPCPQLYTAGEQIPQTKVPHVEHVGTRHHHHPSIQMATWCKHRPNQGIAAAPALLESSVLSATAIAHYSSCVSPKQTVAFLIGYASTSASHSKAFSHRCRLAPQKEGRPIGAGLGLQPSARAHRQALITRGGQPILLLKRHSRVRGIHKPRQ